MTTTDVCNVHSQGFSMLFYDSNEMVLGNQHVSRNLDVIAVSKNHIRTYTAFVQRTKITIIEMGAQKTNDEFFFSFMSSPVHVCSCSILFIALVRVLIIFISHRPRALLSKQENDSLRLLCGRHIEKYEKRLLNIFHITLDGQTKWKKRRKQQTHQQQQQQQQFT